MSQIISPLIFKPILKQTVWGGSQIIPFKHLQLHTPHVGESWEISDVSGDESVVSEGALSGKKLSEVISLYKEQLLGKKVFQAHGVHFPLLIKFIDAQQDLSVQVHPDDALSQSRGFRNGKTEMWYVLEASEGAKLLSGFSQRIDKAEFIRRSNDGTISDVIASHPIHHGDCFFIPAGQVHAIGSGIFLIEIQQTSDVTYRIYDYNRKGLDGQPRQLHIKEAVDAIDYESAPQQKISYPYVQDQRNPLVTCPYFSTSVYSLDHPFVLSIKELDSFVVLIAYQGSFTLQIPSIAPVIVQSGNTVLIPAETPSVIITPGAEGCKFLETHIN